MCCAGHVPDASRPAARPAGRGGKRWLGRVVSTQPVGGMVGLTIELPECAGAGPGQFALVKSESSRHFLGRALSIADERGQEVDFLVAPVGEGTRELCSLGRDDRVWVLGPLGNGFDMDSICAGPGRVILVGGGAGIAPFPLLLSRLPKEQEVLVLMGFRDAVQAGGAQHVRRVVTGGAGKSSKGAVDVEVITEDASSGSGGKVTDLLRRHLRRGDRLAVCGPEAMAREVWRICLATGGVEAWFSLEANMACGLGSCHGCVLAVADGSYKRVCQEGPVFSGKVIFGG